MVFLIQTLSCLYWLYFVNYCFELECADKGLQLLKIPDAADQAELPT